MSASNSEQTLTVSVKVAIRSLIYNISRRRKDAEESPCKIISKRESTARICLVSTSSVPKDCGASLAVVTKV